MWKKSLSRNCLQGKNRICFVTALSPRNENKARNFKLPPFWRRDVSMEMTRTRTHFAAVPIYMYKTNAHAKYGQLEFSESKVVSNHWIVLAPFHQCLSSYDNLDSLTPSKYLFMIQTEKFHTDDVALQRSVYSVSDWLLFCARKFKIWETVVISWLKQGHYTHSCIAKYVISMDIFMSNHCKSVPWA